MSCIYGIEQFCDECRMCEKKENKKVKVTEAEIVVHGTLEKSYFEIRYLEVGKKEYNVGYSSYDLKNVFSWLNEEFEIVKEETNKKTTNADWIRNMSNEELAKWLARNAMSCHCFAIEECRNDKGDDCSAPILKWLESECD